MRYIMMGTGPFAVPTFRALLASSHETVALFTRPARTVPGSKHPPPTPMLDLAQEVGVPIHAPEDVNDPAVVEQLEQSRVDVLVVCDFGQILGGPALSVTRCGGVNLHGSLLPKYRGAAPINWALIRGEEFTGVSVIHMNKQLDAGPILARRETPIGPEEDAVSLELRLSELGAPAVLEALEMLEFWDGYSLLGEIQDRARMTRAPRLKKSDGQIDWTLGAGQIHNRVRGLRPWPGSYTFWHSGKGPPTRLLVNRVGVGESPRGDVSGVPGEVVRAEGDDLWVATGDGNYVALLELQPAGKRAMSASDFLRGHRLHPGDRLA